MCTELQRSARRGSVRKPTHRSRTHGSFRTRNHYGTRGPRRDIEPDDVDFAFCRSLCSSGAYFTLLSRSWVIDLHFGNPEQCIDCDACIRICPTRATAISRSKN